MRRRSFEILSDTNIAFVAGGRVIDAVDFLALELPILTVDEPIFTSDLPQSRGQVLDSRLDPTFP